MSVCGVSGNIFCKIYFAAGFFATLLGLLNKKMVWFYLGWS